MAAHLYHSPVPASAGNEVFSVQLSFPEHEVVLHDVNLEFDVWGPHGPEGIGGSRWVNANLDANTRLHRTLLLLWRLEV